MFSNAFQKIRNLSLLKSVSGFLTSIASRTTGVFSKLFNWIKDFSLIHFVIIGVLVFAACAYFFTHRLASFIALPVRMYIGTLFVYMLFWLDDQLDESMKPWLICAGFLAAGFSL